MTDTKRPNVFTRIGWWFKRKHSYFVHRRRLANRVYGGKFEHIELVNETGVDLTLEYEGIDSVEKRGVGTIWGGGPFPDVNLDEKELPLRVRVKAFTVSADVLRITVKAPSEQATWARRRPTTE